MDAAIVQAIFKRLDKDGNGQIDEDEMCAALSEFGLLAEDIDSIFVRLDTDGNGKVSQDEFSKGWSETMPPSLVEEQCHTVVAQTGSSQDTAKPTGEYNNTVDGVVTMAEVESAVAEVEVKAEVAAALDAERDAAIQKKGAKS